MNQLKPEAKKIKKILKNPKRIVHINITLVPLFLLTSPFMGEE
jgi:hypothetical protein